MDDKGLSWMFLRFLLDFMANFTLPDKRSLCFLVGDIKNEVFMLKRKR